MKTCNDCLVEQPDEAFQWRNKSRPERGRMAICISCKNLRKRRWHKQNRDRAIAYGKRDYQLNRERYNQQCANWRQEHADHDRERKQLWRAENPLYGSLVQGVRRAIAGGLEMEVFTAEDLLLWWSSNKIEPTKCVYCENPWQCLDHVVALSRGGSHTVQNLVPSCNFCNGSKGTKPVHEWLAAKNINPHPLLEQIPA